MTKLQATGPSVAVIRWQPIADAPRDGRALLLTDGSVDEFGQALCVVAFWNGRAWDDGNGHDSMDHFTHWMALPEPSMDQGEE